MTLTNIAQLKASTKVNLRLLITDMFESVYSGGKRMKLTTEDEDGSEISVVGFQDVYDKCSKLQIGCTYVFNDVLSSEYQGKPQIKLVTTSNISDSAVQFKVRSLQLADVKEDMQFVTVIVTGMVETLSSNSKKMLQMRLHDTTGSFDAEAYSAGAECIIDDDTVVRARVKRNGHRLVTFAKLIPVDDDDLKTWWEDSGRAESAAKKKPRVQEEVTVQLAELTYKSIGQRVEVKCDVVYINDVSTTASGKARRSIVVADDTMHAIHVTFFGEDAATEFTVKQVMSLKATVSEWDNLSLIANAWTMHNGETSELEYDDSFKMLTSRKPIEFITVSDVVQNRVNERVDLQGHLQDSFFHDETGNLPVTYHSSFRGDKNLPNGKVKLIGAFYDGTHLELFRAVTCETADFQL